MCEKKLIETYQLKEDKKESFKKEMKKIRERLAIANNELKISLECVIPANSPIDERNKLINIEMAYQNVNEIKAEIIEFKKEFKLDIESVDALINELKKEYSQTKMEI